MRLTIRNVIATTMVAMMTLAVSCGADDADFYTPDNDNGGTTVKPDGGSGMGDVSFESFALYVDAESEDLSNDDYMVDDKTKASDDVKTESTEADGEYLILIFKETTGTDGTVSTLLKKFSYDDIKDLKALELPVGEYSLQARSCLAEEIDPLGTDPQYASVKYPFTIESDKTTQIKDKESGEVVKVINCKLANTKVSLEMAIDLINNFKHDNLGADEKELKVTFSLGETKLEFYYNDGDDRNIINNSPNYYFAVPESGSTLEVTLEGMYNIKPANVAPSYIAVTWTQPIENILPGQYRIIAVNYANYNDGKIHIEFEVSSWTYDTAIGVSIMTGTFYTKGEDEILDLDEFISDENSPVATLANGLNVTDTYDINPELFDDEKKEYAPKYILKLTPHEGSSIKSAVLKIALISNPDFKTALEEAGYTTTIELWNATKSTKADETQSDPDYSLSNYVKVSEDATTKAVTIELLYEGAKLFSDYYGSYQMKLTAIDDQDRESNHLISYNSSNITIKWKDGDFSKRHYIWGEDEYPEEDLLSVVLDIASKTGLTAMKININSKVLTNDILSQLNLKSEMDLIHPESSAMESTLKDLGFPTGDDVEGKTTMTFDLTDFMPMLALLSEAGSGDETDFVITVEDESGAVAKTLMVKRK